MPQIDSLTFFTQIIFLLFLVFILFMFFQLDIFNGFNLIVFLKTFWYFYLIYLNKYFKWRIVSLINSKFCENLYYLQSNLCKFISFNLYLHIKFTTYFLNLKNNYISKFLVLSESKLQTNQIS